jgi:hypothetical protein
MATGASLGDIYSGGQNTAPAPNIERWNPNGSEDPAFTSAIGPVSSIAPAVDGSVDVTDDVYVGGSFTNRIIRLNDSGTPDNLFDVGTGFNADVLNIEPAADGSGAVYAGGEFTAYNATSANGILRLNEDGSREPNFIIGSGFTDLNDPSSLSKVASVARTTDGTTDVYVGGGFDNYNGTDSNGIARLNADGSLDTGFAVEISVDGRSCNNNSIFD